MGIFVDSDLVMRTHVTMCQTVSRCFAELRQPRSIRYLVSLTVFQSLLVTASVLSRLDYGLTSLHRLPHPSISVGPERSDTAHIAAPSLRSHH